VPNQVKQLGFKEAKDSIGLARGMQGLSVRMARALNRL